MIIYEYNTIGVFYQGCSGTGGKAGSSVGSSLPVSLPASEPDARRVFSTDEKRQLFSADSQTREALQLDGARVQRQGETQTKAPSRAACMRG